MRDGATRPRSTSPPHTTWMPSGIQAPHWRQHSRLRVLRIFAEAARGIRLSRRLLNALLEELHVSDDFDRLVGSVDRVLASQYPRLLAIALLVRHSWNPQDLDRIAEVIGLPRAIEPASSPTHRKSLTTGNGGHHRRRRPRASPAGPRTSRR